MELIKKILGDKRKIVIAVVCLLMFSVAIVSDISGKKLVDNTDDYNSVNLFSVALNKETVSNESDNYDLSNLNQSVVSKINLQQGVGNYYVAYFTNGGSFGFGNIYYPFMPFYQKKEHGVDYVVIDNIPKRTGWTFAGWGVTKNATINEVAYEPGETYTEDANLNLFAIWQKNSNSSDDSGSGETTDKITVTFISNYGFVEPESKEVEYGKEYGDLPTPISDEYDFIDWYSESGELITKNSKVTIDANHKLYAKWTPKSISNGDDENVPLKDWTDIYNDIMAPIFTKISTASVTLNPNGGRIGGSVYPTTIKVKKGESYGELPTPEREGYTFDGWYTYANKKVTASMIVNVDHLLVAKWTAISSDEGDNSGNTNTEKITYRIKYDSNGGQGEMSESIHISNEPKKLEKNTFTRPEHEFVGWNTEKEGTGINYADEFNVTNLSNINNDTVILYAQWRKISDENPENPSDNPETEESLKLVYYVKYDSNGGTGEMTTSRYFFNEAGNLSENTFIKDKNIFVGWNTEADGSGFIFNDQQTISNLATNNGEIITLYAQWFNLDFGMDPDSNLETDVEQDVITESPQTGSLQIILVSIAVVGALGGIMYYRKKTKI